MFSSTKLFLALFATILIFSFVAKNEVSASPVALAMAGPDPEPCEESKPKKEKKDKKKDKLGKMFDDMMKMMG